jgi:hypothetical protein
MLNRDADEPQNLARTASPELLVGGVSLLLGGALQTRLNPAIAGAAC